MSKILVLGDTHGRSLWKDIINIENPDLTIFLGDYVTTHENISPQHQIQNLIDIMAYKTENPDKVIMLRGNHDTESCSYYWAQCYPQEPVAREWLTKHKDEFLDLTQWIYIDEDLKTIFSHAGISQVWMNDIAHVQDVHEINNLEPSEIFGFTPNNYCDNYGDSETQPPTWIRPQSLRKCNVEGWDQVVGHTPQNGISKMQKNCKGKHTIWLCDALGVEQYLIIDNGEFQTKTFKQ